MPYTNSSVLTKIDVASKTKLGLVQIGNNIDVTSSGVISVDKASTSNLGVVQVGSNINVSSSGVISVNKASASTYGVVKIGNGLSSDNNGVISTTSTIVIKDRRNGLPVYVRTNGNDNNDGLTEAKAVKTIAKAVEILYKLDFGYYFARINVGTGTFDITSILFEKVPLCKSFAILSGAGKGQTILTSGNLINNIQHRIEPNANWQFVNLTLRTTTSTGAAININNGNLVMNNVAVEAGVPTSNALVAVKNGGVLGISGGCTFNGTANHFVVANSTGMAHIYNGTVTFNGTATISTVSAAHTGVFFVSLNGNATGSVTGKRYIASQNGVIFTQGRGPNVFPGTVAGEVNSGGIYN